ncbi:hypothetical protein CsSME_00039124 [Camellia sinensis var. sinensis]
MAGAVGRGGGGMRLIVLDFMQSFMWVWSGVLIKMFVHSFLGLGFHEPKAEAIKCVLSILNMFFFAYLGKITKGATYNPLTVLASAISGDFSRFLFTVGARIPAQASFDFMLNLFLFLFLFLNFGMGFDWNNWFWEYSIPLIELCWFIYLEIMGFLLCV